MKILIIALSGIGDALMFSPALQLLRQQYPQAQIDLLSMFKGVQDIYKTHPALTNIFHWDFLHRSPLSSLSYIFSLRKKKYDISISVYPQNRWEYNVISYFIGAPTRLGHEYQHWNKRSLYFLNNRRIKENNQFHNVEENIELVKMLDVPSPEQYPPLQIFLTEEEKQNAQQWFKQKFINTKNTVIGFHAGSALLKNHVHRRWFPEKFAELGKNLIEKHQATILLFGGPEEYELNNKIFSLIENKNVYIVQTQSLRETVGIMSQCSIMVSNDSGLMHVAAALQIPTIAIFAYTNPTFVHPWKTKYNIVRKELECSPCFYYSPKPATCQWQTDKFHCNNIEVEQVYNAVKKMIEEV